MSRLKMTEVLTLHPSVIRLAKAMQAKLDRDEVKGPWHLTPPHELLVLMLGEVVELSRARGDWYAEAADVANYAMMFADASGYMLPGNDSLREPPYPTTRTCELVERLK